MRRVILFLCCLLIAGCTNNNEQLELYNRLLLQADEYEKTDNETLPVDIEVYCEQIIDGEITYRVIIDNPKEAITNIKAIAIHNHETKDVYPTSGIFETPLNLIPNNIDLDKNNAKGIILVGYIETDINIEKFKISIKVMIEYENANGESKQIYYEYQK